MMFPYASNNVLLITSRITASAEKLRYFPRECTSPGILKRPDANLNICSPKSPKVCNLKLHKRKKVHV